MRFAYLNAKSKLSGFTIVEMLIYVAIFSVVSIASVLFMFSLTDFIGQYKVETALYRSGTDVMEQILISARQADEVDLLNTTLDDSSNGQLTVTHSASSTSFAIDAGTLQMTVDNILLGNLLSEGVTVTGLTISHYPLTVGELVRVKLELSATVNSVTKTLNVYDGAVIRGAL